MPDAWLSSRVSSGPQERGGGHRRQESAEAVAAAQRWCERHGYRLRDTLRFTGSAYKGLHMRPGAPQREWLERAIRGELGERPALLVESVDRLTRQAGHEADGGLAELLYRAFPVGVVIVDLGEGTTYSTEAFARDDRLLGDLVEEARLAHRESLKKSRRLMAHWDQVRQDIAAGRIVRPRQLAPWWVDGRCGRWELNDHADLARRMFELAAEHGSVVMTRILNAEGVRPPGRRQGEQWHTTAVMATLRNPAAWGCCRIQGMEPVPRVFPAIVSRDRFDLVQARIEARKGSPAARGHRQEARWLGAGLSTCTCGWTVGTTSVCRRGKKVWRYIGCLRHRAHGRSCAARFVRIEAANAHLLARLQRGELRALLAVPERDGRIRAAQAAERVAREALAVAAQRRGNAERAVRDAVLRGQEHSLLLEVANDARAEEERARLAAAEAGAAVGRLLGQGPASPVEEAVERLLQAVAVGEETAEQRRAVNTGLRSLGIRLCLDVEGHLPLMGIASGEGPWEWQPVVSDLAVYALGQGAACAQFWPDGEGVDWPA